MILFNIADGEKALIRNEPGETVLDAAKRSGVIIDAPCGGNGTCGKCRVKLVSGKLSGEKSKLIDDKDYDDGWRIACGHSPDGDVEIFVPAEATAFQNRIRVTDFSGTREKASFETLRTVLNELSFSGDSGIEQVRVKLDAPTQDDARADRERFIMTLASNLNITEDAILVTLYAMRKLPTILRKADFLINAVIRRKADGTVTVIDIITDTKLYGVAIDIGTTTVSVLLVDMVSGNPVASASGGNAQIRYGADVINRIIESTKNGGLEKLRRALVEECLNPLICRLCANAGISPNKIYRSAIAGNTTMAHLFLAIPPEYLRLEPYVPAFFEYHDIAAGAAGLAINPEASIVIAPAIGSYVGGDITAGVFAADFYRKNEFSLFIDLGTNGELVFGNREFLFACACSAGPAFEGGEISCGMRATNGAIEKCSIDQETGELNAIVIGDAGTKIAGICGSGLIDIIGEMFRTGIIDAKGKFTNAEFAVKRTVKNEYGEPGYIAAFASESENGRDIVLNETDIDNFIRAKGAIFSAIRTMLAIVDFSIDAIERVYVAGGIGSGIDITHAILIGMFPKLTEDKYTYIGNSSLSGAYAMLCSQEATRKVHEISGGITYLELSSHPSYMDEFVAACFLPHTDAALFY